MVNSPNSQFVNQSTGLIYIKSNSCPLDKLQECVLNSNALFSIVFIVTTSLLVASIFLPVEYAINLTDKRFISNVLPNAFSVDFRSKCYSFPLVYWLVLYVNKILTFVFDCLVKTIFSQFCEFVNTHVCRWQ